MKWLGGGLIVAALLIYGLGSAFTYRWVAVYGLCALAGAIWAWRGVITLKLADFFLLALFAWAALSILWSTDQRTGLYDIINASALLGVYFLSRHIYRVIPLAVTISAVGALVLIYLYPEDNGGFGNANFSTEFLLLAAPFVAWWGYEKPWQRIAGLILLVMLGTLYYIPSKIEYAVFAVAGVIGAHLALHKGVGAVLVAIALVLVLTYTDAGESLLARSEIAINTLALWFESPVWGHGLGSFGLEYDRVREFHLGYIDKWAVLGAASFAGAAHNEYLQLMSATGLIGLLLLGAFVWAVLGGKHSVSRTACLSVLGIGAVLALIEFPMQNPWTAVLLTMAAGVATKGHPDMFHVKHNGFWNTVLILAVVTGSMTVIAGKTYVAGVHMGTFRAAAGRAHLQAFSSNLKAYETYPLERYPRMQLAMTLAALSVEYKERLVISPEAADKVYDIARTAAGYMPAVLIARGQYLINSGRVDVPEMETILNRLKKYSGQQPTTWLLNAWVGLFTDDVERIFTSLDTLRELRMTGENHIYEAGTILSYLKPKESQ